MMNQQNLCQLRPADLAQALAATKNSGNRYYKGEEVSSWCQLSHFKIYGSGIYLFFLFVKYMSITLLLMTLVSIGPIAFNAKFGNTLKNSENSLAVVMTKASLGSHDYDMISSEDSYNKSISYKVFNVVFDLVNCGLFLLFCFVWRYKSLKICNKIHQQIKLQSKLTVQVTAFPPSAKQLQIEKFMEQFGNVVETAAVKQSSSEIELARQIFELEQEIKEIELGNQVGSEFEAKRNQQTKAYKRNEIAKLYEQLQQKKCQQRKTIQFYVQYSSLKEASETIEYFQKHQRLFSCCSQTPGNIFLEGTKVEVIECESEPSQIIWENAHVTWLRRLPRLVLQTVIILGVIFGGFLLICLLNALIPSTNTDLPTDTLTYEDIQKSTKSGEQQSWCIKNFALDGSASPYYGTCASYWQKYTMSVVVSVCIAFVVMIVCEIIKKIIYLLADFMKYRNQAQRSTAVLTNLFLADFTTTTLTTFLMQANIFSLSVLDFLSRIITISSVRDNIAGINEYGDLESGWYKDIGYQIWLNILVMCVVPHIYMPLWYRMCEWVQEWRAGREKLHSKLMDRLRLPEFEIEDHYSNLLMILATAVMFGGGIPLMMVVGCLCFASRYLYLKHIFIRYCATPPAYNDNLNKRVIQILQGILVARLLLSIYMYGADKVFAKERSTFMAWSESLTVPVIRSLFIVISRILLTWYYSLVSLIFIVLMIVNDLVYVCIERCRMGTKIANKPRKHSQQLQAIANIDNKAIPGALEVSNQEILEQVGSALHASSFSSSLDEIRTQKNGIRSYKLENNPEYAHLAPIMRARIRRSEEQKVVSQPLDITF